MRVTRRGLFAGSTGLVVAALVPVASAKSADNDTELTALGSRFEQAFAAHQAAEMRFNETERHYLEDGPDPPAALTRAGSLGKLLAYEGAWWRAHALRSLLRDSEYSEHWQNARAALPVALAYEARDRRFRRKIGLRDAERAHAQASDAMDELSAGDAGAIARSARRQGARGENVGQARMVERGLRARRYSRAACRADPRRGDHEWVSGAFGHRGRSDRLILVVTGSNARFSDCG